MSGFFPGRGVYDGGIKGKKGSNGTGRVKLGQVMGGQGLRENMRRDKKY